MKQSFSSLTLFTFLLLIFSGVANAATFTVENVNESGIGSLADAIDESNLTPGKDTILFNIPGNGPHVIAPSGTTALPILFDPVLIDGYSQPGSTRATRTSPATLKIVISGANLGPFTFSGIRIETDDTEIHGLSIINFSVGHGIFILNGDNNEIMGNHIGLGASGTITRDKLNNVIPTANAFGIALKNSSSHNKIGNSDAWTRNVISGNLTSDVILTNFLFGATGASAMVFNSIQNNYIGTDADGNIVTTSPLPGLQNAITLTSALHTQIGGNTETEGNLIAGKKIGVSIGALSPGMLSGFTTVEGNDFVDNGISINLLGPNNTIGGSSPDLANMISNTDNASTGIMIFEADDNEILSNYIGFARSGRTTNDTPGDGITIRSSSGNAIGAPDDGNFIAAHGVGIKIISASGSDSIENSISENSIPATPYGDVGIDLGGDGITINDQGDLDSGANELLNYPELISANINATRSGMDVTYDLDAQPGDIVTVELFSSRTCGRHGDRFVGSASFVIPTAVQLLASPARQISQSAQSLSKIRPDSTTKGRYQVRSPITARIRSGENITATATVNNNTSEFSDCISVM